MLGDMKQLGSYAPSQSFLDCSLPSLYETQFNCVRGILKPHDLFRASRFATGVGLVHPLLEFSANEKFESSIANCAQVFDQHQQMWRPSLALGSVMVNGLSQSNVPERPRNSHDVENFCEFWTVPVDRV